MNSYDTLKFAYICWKYFLAQLQHRAFVGDCPVLERRLWQYLSYFQAEKKYKLTLKNLNYGHI